MDTTTILECMAMDLKRVAIGYHRGSTKMADRFAQEALKRKQEVKLANIPAYIQNILQNLEHTLQEKDNSTKADYALAYSTLLQNYVVSDRNIKKEL